MNLSTLPRAIGALVLACAATATQAADVGFAGNSTYNTDIVRIGFSLASAGAVKVWTDSWQSGLNYDPVAAVWLSTGSGYTLVSEVDDDDTVGSGQGAFDAGISFASLGAGQYLLTIAASPNYANGSSLAAGFALDGSAPIRIADWNQPGYDINANDQKGTAWRVNLSGVTQAAVLTPVPEPSTWLLMALGLAGVLSSARRPASRQLAGSTACRSSGANRLRWRA